MDDIQDIDFSGNQLLLITGFKSSLRFLIPQLIARVSIQNTLVVIDAGNTYREYVIARELKNYTNLVNESIKHILHHQTSNIPQLITKLERMGNPSTPVFILDILVPFYPETGSVFERERALHRVLDTISKISARNSVLMSCAQSNNKYFQDWFANIRQYADEVVYQEQSQGPENYKLF